MKKINKTLVWLGIIILALATAAWGQGPGAGGMGVGRGHGGGHGGGMGPGGDMGMVFNPQNLSTIKCEVTRAQQSGGRGGGLHLQVKTDKETLMVLVGPVSYLEQHKMQIAAGDQVEITGYKIQHPRQARLIASEIKKGNQVVKLRDEQGNPLWAGQGRMRNPSQ